MIDSDLLKDLELAERLTNKIISHTDIAEEHWGNAREDVIDILSSGIHYLLEENYIDRQRIDDV